MKFFHKLQKSKKRTSDSTLDEMEVQVIGFAQAIESNEKKTQIGYDDGLLVFPAKTALRIVEVAKRDPRLIEKMLDFPTNYLGNNPVIIGIKKEHVKNLRIPSGNEKIFADLDDHWIPGGIRKTNVPEAIIDPVASDKVLYYQI